MLLSVFLMLLLGRPILSYKNYQPLIPNGEKVPHPCKPNAVWEGVGHLREQGTGYRNPFGEDFQAAGLVS